MTVYPKALLWVDLESTGVDTDKDEILEVGFIVTDYNLNPSGYYKAVVKLTREGALRVRDNQIVLDMHVKSGLLKESRDGILTIEEVEQDVISWLRKLHAYEPGEYTLAGSGIATFDMQLIKKQMPELHSWLTYYVWDVGIFRRMFQKLAGKRLVEPPEASFKDGVKVHRALDDAKAHLEEAALYQSFLRKLS